MKLIARVTRGTDSMGRPWIRCTFPKGTRVPFMRESVLMRNLGQRPYAEGFSVNREGEAVCTYFATYRREVIG